MAGVNKVILLGRVSNDIELKELTTSKVANFNLATSENYKDATGEVVEKTEFHKIVMWGKLAELASSYLSKGREVFIEGKLQTRKWQDQNGNDRYTTEVVGTNMNFVGSKSEPLEASTSNQVSKPKDEGDLPF